MAVCGSLQHIFESPRPEKNPQTLFESLSPWNQLKSTPAAADETLSFTELFGELHFKETPTFNEDHDKPNKSPEPISRSYAGTNSESLQLCKEGLGFESSYDMENSKGEVGNDTWQEHKARWEEEEEEESCTERFRRGKWKVRRDGEDFPPPITSIGKSERPWVCFKAYREDGRFVLEEVRIPTREILHASRQDGRLRMKLVQPDDEDDEDENPDQDEEEEDGE